MFLTSSYCFPLFLEFNEFHSERRVCFQCYQRYIIVVWKGALTVEVQIDLKSLHSTAHYITYAAWDPVENRGYGCEEKS